MDASSTFSPAFGANTPSLSVNSENSNDQLPVWVETKTKDNKVYYYSSTTKETTWKRPENVRIIKYEDLAKKGQQQQQQQGSTSSYSNHSKSISANVPNSFDNNHHHSNSYANNVKPATLMQNNSPNISIAPTFQPFGLPPPTMFNTRPPMTLPPMGIGPPAAMAAAMAATMRFPPLGMAGGLGLPMTGLPNGPNMMAMSPFMPPGWRPNVANAALVNRPMISETDIQRRIYLTQVSADLRDRALDWQEYKTPDNQYYFLNIKTSERTTEKPEVIQELDDAIAVIKEQKAKKAIEEAKAQEGSPGQQKGEVNKVGTNNNENRLEDTDKKSPNTAQSDSQSKAASGKQKEGMKPVSTTAVPGSPWCVVWTDKNRVFYFNPSTKTSVWERPAELRNREDVDKMVSNPILPNSQADDESRQSTSSDQSLAQAEKKIKLDSNSGSSAANQSAPSKPTVVPKIMKKEVASEIEKEAAKKRESISFEERVVTFKNLLEEKEVNPASTFQKELSKIVFDPRYLLLTSVERRDVFEKWCIEKKEADHQKRRERIKKATSEFNKLLEEANLTSHLRYDDFHSQYSKDPRYTALERTKDREILFDDHLAMLRRRERDERTHKKRPSEHRSVPRSISKEEAENIFYALLVEFIIDPDIDWHEGKRILRRNPQWDLTADLPREWKEAEYNRHLDKIYLRRRDKFHQLLSETKHITLASEWRDVKRIIIDDPRYIKFSSSERRCEREFREFIKKKRVTAEDNFRHLLRETTLIDGNTRKKIEESEHQHLIDIIGTLQNDKRYVDLEPFGEERRKILLSYIEELAATSSESSAPATSTSVIKSPQRRSMDREHQEEVESQLLDTEKMSNLNNNDDCSKNNENKFDSERTGGGCSESVVLDEQTAGT